MLGAHRALADAGLASRLLLQVHDELVVEVAPGEAAAVEALVRREMGAAVAMDVPLDVSVGVGGPGTTPATDRRLSARCHKILVRNGRLLARTRTFRCRGPVYLHAPLAGGGPAGSVFAVLADPDRYDQWWPQIRSVIRLGPDDGLARVRSLLPLTLTRICAGSRRTRPPAARRRDHERPDGLGAMDRGTGP